jgi:YfiR/HmsC-like
MGRRWALRVSLVTLALAVTLASLPSLADEEVAVPVPLQMELLVKIAGYDKNLPARARDVVRILILTKGDGGQSSQVAQQAVRALSGKTIANRSIDVSTASYTDGDALSKRVKERGIAIVYATPGFGQSDLEAMAKALSGASVLSAGAVARFVNDGVVLGFDLVSGKPKLLVHLRRAKDQNVDLSSQVLKFVKVIE